MIRVLAASLMMAGASVAGAATVTATYTGEVSNSTDAVGLFGGSGDDPSANDGERFALTFVFDPDAVGTLRLGLGGYSPIYDESYDFSYGGSDNDRPTPSLGVELTIGGTSQAFVGDVHFNAFIGESRYQTIAIGSTAGSYVGEVTAAIVNQHLLLPALLEQPFTLAVLPNLNLFPSSAFSFRDPGCGAGDPSCDVTGSLRLDALTVSVAGIGPGPDLTPAHVPLPASAALLLAALACMGGSRLRRGRKTARSKRLSALSPGDAAPVTRLAAVGGACSPSSRDGMATQGFAQGSGRTVRPLGPSPAQ